MKKSSIAILSVIILVTAGIATLASCKKHRAEKQKKKDDKIIQQYISDHGLKASSTDDGLYYVITDAGTGKQPTMYSTVTVDYKGYLTDGNVFDQTPASGATFALTQVIKGWQEGIPLFKVGGKGMLLIPSALGYGSQATGDIPKNSVLIFDIRLLDVQ